ncbi:unnamed protein product [Trichobilharzia regenti]|nr:unnamed protein product [Trichobilharzia regenti]
MHTLLLNKTPFQEYFVSVTNKKISNRLNNNNNNDCDGNDLDNVHKKTHTRHIVSYLKSITDQ